MHVNVTLLTTAFRASSHEPGTVNYPGASVTSRPWPYDDLLFRGNVAPDQLHCLGASSSSSDHYKFIGIALVFTQIVTENEFYTRLSISGAFWNFFY